ncbi:MAG: imelysin family protein [Bacteroidota bacterium]
MRWTLSLAFLLSLGLAAGLVACDGDTQAATDDRAAVRAAMLADLAGNVIEPTHAAFAVDAAALQTAVDAFVGDPNATTLAAAQSAWVTAAVQWEKLSALNLPSIQFGLYHNRISIWPTDLFEVEQLLASNEAVDVDFVNRQGSNKRGLPVLEYLLFADGMDAQGPASADAVIAAMGDANRSAYAAAVAADVVAKANDLVEVWSRDGGDELGMFEAANSEGRNLQSSVSRIVNEMAMVTEDLRYVLLGRPFGIARNPEDPDTPPDPMRVQAPYAQISAQLFEANLEGMRALITAGGGTGLDDYLATLDATFDGQPFGSALLAQLDATEAAVEALDPTLFDAVSANPTGGQAAHDSGGDLIRIIKVDLAAQLGVSITFSDNDGDSG